MSAPILDEDWLRANVWPRFSRALARKEIYLANHSLGRPPDRMAEDVRSAIDAWYHDLDGAWADDIAAHAKRRQINRDRPGKGLHAALGRVVGGHLAV